MTKPKINFASGLYNLKIGCCGRTIIW